MLNVKYIVNENFILIVCHFGYVSPILREFMRNIKSFLIRVFFSLLLFLLVSFLKWRSERKTPNQMEIKWKKILNLNIYFLIEIRKCK